MPRSPWIPFPPFVDNADVTYPINGSTVWVRFRDFTRRPFRVVWDNDTPPYAQGKVLNSDGGTISGYFVPWFVLDAWHPL